MTDNPNVSPAVALVTADNPVVLLDHRTQSSDGVQPDSVPEHSPGVAALVELTRVVTITLVVIAGALLTPRFTAAGEDPADFIRIPGNRGLEGIRSRSTLDQKPAYYQKVLSQDFDLSETSRFVL